MGREGRERGNEGGKGGERGNEGRGGRGIRTPSPSKAAPKSRSPFFNISTKSEA